MASILEQILIGSLAGVTVILIYYYLFVFARLSRFKTKPKKTNQVPVSVIIAAKNELTNLKENLLEILNQDYSDFEVVLVNDGSYDGTKDYIEKLSETEHRLNPVQVMLDERYQKGKKFALTMGIKAAKHNRLVFTDADCKPKSKQWLKSIVEQSDKEIILGFGPLKTKNTLLGSLIQYETFHTALQYFSYALGGNAYMGVGRNLSYTKDLFFKNKGFANHQHILSGDDDLFIQDTATKYNTSICLNQDSFMESNGPASLSSWFKQKVRHISTSKHYSKKHKLQLGLYSLAQILFYILLSLCLILNIYPIYILGGLLLKWIIQLLVFWKPAKMLNQKKIAWALPYYDFLYVIYLLVFGLINPFVKVKTWN